MSSVAGLLEEEASQYVEAYDGEPPASQKEIKMVLDGDLATEEEVYEAADELIEFYDELLDLEEDQERNKSFRDQITYNPDRSELLKPRADANSAVLYASGIGCGLLMSFNDPGNAPVYTALGLGIGHFYNARMNRSLADASYDSFSGTIGVSSDETTVLKAVDVLSAELVHAYQERLDSVTWGGKDIFSRIDPRSPPIREGFERASRIKALEHLGETDFMDQDWEELADKRKASTVVNGFLEASSSDVEEARNNAEQIGLEQDTTEKFADNFGGAESCIYDVIASKLLVRERNNPEIFSDVFHGEKTV